MSMKLHGGGGDDLYQPVSEINVTPLVDVMLVLLIIFMVTAPLLSTGLKVNLPRANSAQSLNPKEPLVVTVDKQGRISFRGDPIGLDAVGEAVRLGLDGDQTRIVHIRGDEATGFGRIVAVMDRLAAAGVAHIAIVTDGKAPPPRPAPTP